MTSSNTYGIVTLTIDGVTSFLQLVDVRNLRKNTRLLMGMVVIQPYILVSKVKKIKTKFLRCTGYLNSIKKNYKARFIANFSSCTTTELSKLLTSCLTAVKKHVIKYCEKVYERSGKNLFWSIKNSGEILDKLKARDFNATSLSTYDFSTLYTTLPHN